MKPSIIQGYPMEHSIVHQDNQSSMLLRTNISGSSRNKQDTWMCNNSLLQTVNGEESLSWNTVLLTKWWVTSWPSHSVGRNFVGFRTLWWTETTTILDQWTLTHCWLHTTEQSKDVISQVLMMMSPRSVKILMIRKWAHRSVLENEPSTILQPLEWPIRIKWMVGSNPQEEWEDN